MKIHQIAASLDEQGWTIGWGPKYTSFEAKSHSIVQNNCYCLKTPSLELSRSNTPTMVVKN
jgi:hypothetical protein